MTQNEQVVAALQTGPKRVFEIAQLSGLPSNQISRVALLLVRRKVVQKVGGRSRAFIYALAPDYQMPAARGTHFMEMERQYVALRYSGVPAPEAGERLGLAIQLRYKLETLFHAQIHGISSDSSVPRFAEHERHLAAVSSATAGAGFPAFVLAPRRRMAA